MAEEYKKEIIERLNNVQQERLLKIMLDCVKSLESKKRETNFPFLNLSRGV